MTRIRRVLLSSSGGAFTEGAFLRENRVHVDLLNGRYSSVAGLDWCEVTLVRVVAGASGD